MSSDNKKSVTSIILIALIFAVIAGLSLVYFSKNKTSDMEKNKQELANQVVENINGETNNEINQPEATSAEETLGIKGKIQDLVQPAIYGERAVGDPNAPVKVREFFSLTCNHCANFYKGPYQDIKRNLIDTGKLYFIYEEFPLNGPALYGSMIARCLPKERYIGFIDILLRTQDEWAFGGDFKAGLMQNAKLAGMSEEEFDTCFNNAELQKAVASNIKEASEIWKVNSTPSFVFNNGERILFGEQSTETFEKLVTELMKNTDVSSSQPETIAPTTETSTPMTEAPAPVSEEVMPAVEEPKAVPEEIKDMEEKVEDLNNDLQGIIEDHSETVNGGAE